MKIDFKSLIIGLLLGVFAIFLSGYSGSDNGRYECSASGSWVFVIDTQTGQVWHIDHGSTIDFGTPTNRKSKETYITPKG